ncbi:MAG: hypothetical protein KAU20_02340 [Nanoarchaeota archaeon]|nr:hypothetical protein [Nanoarchaeota archaeon]
MSSVKSLKKRIDKAGRKEIAKRTGITYHVLSHKLNGFSEFKEEEIAKIEKALSKTGE